MIAIPEWAVLAALSAFFQAVMPLVQERYKADGFALAVGVKVVVAAITLPFALMVGLPTAPEFYIALAIMSVVWCISDVVFYRAVPVVGAGVISRLLPATTMATFLLWFAVDPALVDKYLASPVVSTGIVACILLAAFCASRLQRCAVSRQAVRLLWFVLLAGTVGPIMYKLIVSSAPGPQGVFAYASMEALMMIALWTVYAVVRRPVARAAWTSPATVKASLGIGLAGSFVLVLGSFAMQATEHPSYVTVLRFTDALWIILIYKLVGRRESANVRAGLGIVAAAAGLVLLKSL